MEAAGPIVRSGRREATGRTVMDRVAAVGIADRAKQNRRGSDRL
jgi:hypothetical protein